MGLKRSQIAKDKFKQTLLDNPETFDHIAVPILCYNLKGDFIRKFKSINIAARELNIDRSGIYQCNSGKTKRFKSYIFKPYCDDFVNKIEPYKNSLKDKKRSAEVVLRASSSNKAMNHKRSLEQRVVLGNNNRGRIQSDEEKQKRSLSHKGKKKTQEHIDKVAISQRLPVYQFDINNNFIAHHLSLRHASEALNVTRGTICKSLKGINKTCKGFKLSYTKELV